MFPKAKEPAQNSRSHKGDKKKFAHAGSTNSRRQYKLKPPRRPGDRDLCTLTKNEQLRNISFKSYTWLRVCSATQNPEQTLKIRYRLTSTWNNRERKR